MAELAKIPRATIALLESGDANPTLAVLARLSGALEVSIDEILSPPRSVTQYFPKGSLPIRTRDRGAVEVRELLPDPLSGLRIERLELGPHGRLTGVPHRPGTREYLTCERGRLKLFAGGDETVLSPGDVIAFAGDQPHAYHNPTKRIAVGYSVVALT